MELRPPERGCRNCRHRACAARDMVIGLEQRGVLCRQIIVRSRALEVQPRDEHEDHDGELHVERDEVERSELRDDG